MKREFTKREKILMLVLVVVLVATGYLKFFSEPVSSQLAQAELRLADAQDAALVEQTKLERQQEMEKELEQFRQSGSEQTAVIPEYSNIENVMVQLDAILSTATDYQLTFADVEYGEDLVSRPIQMTFTAPNYARAKAILTNLYNCWYRCALSDITVTSSDTQGDVSAQSVSVSLTVTFFEKNNAAAAADNPDNAPDSGSADSSAGA